MPRKKSPSLPVSAQVKPNKEPKYDRYWVLLTGLNKEVWLPYDAPIRRETRLAPKGREGKALKELWEAEPWVDHEVYYEGSWETFCVLPSPKRLTLRVTFVEVLDTNKSLEDVKQEIQAHYSIRRNNAEITLISEESLDKVVDSG